MTNHIFTFIIKTLKENTSHIFDHIYVLISEKFNSKTTHKIYGRPPISAFTCIFKLNKIKSKSTNLAYGYSNSSFLPECLLILLIILANVTTI